MQAAYGGGMRARRRTRAALGVALAAAVAASGCAGQRGDGETPVPQPSDAALDASGLSKLPLAPDARRVDLTAPPFSDPTRVSTWMTPPIAWEPWRVL